MEKPYADISGIGLFLIMLLLNWTNYFKKVSKYQ
ncbi:hypothetical protein PAECIP111894_03709 [Paenibacillus pseudetheri]|uniref:Uncharacterized protein n=1 Tax=Paenibacillus pseudetheri TaxID=2897682 RepID=A0ABN8FPP8_9BACL|nr:hypothetical protein PAECIP111894_03709 [Paenibacillus pseudetheri]